MKHLIFLIAFLLFGHASNAGTWLVGPTRNYTKPSQISALVQNGDTILIDAGVYLNDVARWTAHNLLFRGAGGYAHLKCGGNVYGGKAIWVIVGNDVTVENIEFSEAACPDHNGAGIRSEGINLTLRHCYFHDNEDGILAGDIASGDFLIEYCEFARNGYSDGLAHNLYINHAHSVTFRYNYSHDAKVGHEFKSRAYTNYIYCNRFSDELGSASRSIDLPNGGFSVIVGNIIVQDQFSENSNLLGYGMEGPSNPNSELYVAYNTFVNNKGSGSFIQMPNTVSKALVWNNIFAGPGTVISGSPLALDTLSNRNGPLSVFHFADAATYDFHIDASSAAAGIATEPAPAGVFSLKPEQEYAHVANFTHRIDLNDSGAYALAGASGVREPAGARLICHPNPVSRFLWLEGIDGADEITVYSLTGQTLLQVHGQAETDLSSLPSGVYLIGVIGPSGFRSARIIKE